MEYTDIVGTNRKDKAQNKKKKNYYSKHTTPARGHAPHGSVTKLPNQPRQTPKTPQRNSADPKIQSRRSDIHSGSRPYPTQIDDHVALETKADTTTSTQHDGGDLNAT